LLFEIDGVGNRRKDADRWKLMMQARAILTPMIRGGIRRTESMICGEAGLVGRARTVVLVMREAPAD